MSVCVLKKKPPRHNTNFPPLPCNCPNYHSIFLLVLFLALPPEQSFAEKITGLLARPNQQDPVGPEQPWYLKYGSRLLGIVAAFCKSLEPNKAPNVALRS